jgi:hypothetical protein
MPNRRPPAVTANTSAPTRTGFRERYDLLETQRAALVARLTSLSEAAHRHPGYKRAFTLLNVTFRRAKLAQRLAVLQAATWLIDVLERFVELT